MTGPDHTNAPDPASPAALGGGAPRTPAGVDAVRLAVGTLTTWRTRPPTRVDARVAGRAMLLAPVVVLPLAGAVTALVAAAAVTGRAPAVVAALSLVVVALSTRGLHLDGLADLADGLCAGFDAQRSLAVMKRSDTGAGGVAAVALVLLVQFAAIATLARTVGGAAVVGGALLVSRQMLPWSCRRGVAAATSGGLGATVAGTVATWAVAATSAALLVLAVLVGALAGAQSVWFAVAAAVGVLAGHAVVHVAHRRLGGITGDVLGAAVEVTFAATLAAAAALLG